MSSNIENKKVVVEEIKEKIAKAKSIVFIDYTGITVDKDTLLRKECRENGVDYKVYKNRLLVRALSDSGINDCDKRLEGLTAVAFSYNDEVSAARITAKAISGVNTMSTKFGVYNGKIVEKEFVGKLATLPSKEALISQLMSVMKGPIKNMAYVLSEYSKKQ